MTITAISVADWDRFEVPPGYQAEIIGGELVVTPSATPLHGFILSRLAVVFEPFLPAGVVALSDVEWHLPQSGQLASAPRPDLMIVNADDILGARLTAVPLLVVEILSPSDFHSLEGSDKSRIQAKREDYANNGVRHYLEVSSQSLVVTRFAFDRSIHSPVALASGDDRITAETPFRYLLGPSDLTVGQ